MAWAEQSLALGELEACSGGGGGGGGGVYASVAWAEQSLALGELGACSGGGGGGVYASLAWAVQSLPSPPPLSPLASSSSPPLPPSGGEMGALEVLDLRNDQFFLQTHNQLHTLSIHRLTFAPWE